METCSKQVLREQYLERSRSFIGTPWKHKGRTKNGIDCIGLPYVVGKEMGLHTYDDSLDYGREARNNDFMKALAPYGVRLKDLSEIQDADILVLRIPIWPQHVAIASHIGDVQTIIHASVDARKVVEEPLSNDVKRLLIAAFRYKDFT